MKILINATNIKVGGGLQASVSIISNILKNSRGIEWFFVVSESVYRQIVVTEKNKSKFIVCNLLPTSLKSILKAREKLSFIESNINPDFVYTLFGPSYWEPSSAKHLVGFANAWLVNPKSKAYTVYPFMHRSLIKLKNLILGKIIFNKKNLYVTETNDMKKQFCDYYNFDKKNIFVVGNTVSHYFHQKHVSSEKFEKLRNDHRIKFLTVSYNYPHKNLSTIAKLGKMLEADGCNFVFVVTFPEAEYAKMPFEFRKYTYNIGPLDIKFCPEIYDVCDILYLPTLIECFTVSYLEAMVKKLPILTSDLSFAHDICASSAYYFNPYEIEDIHKKTKILLNDISNGFVDKKINQYDQILNKFGNIDNKVDSYVDIFTSV